MNIDLQQILVSLFLLVPGFISTGILKSVLPKKYDTDFQWVVSSLLISVILNAALIFIILPLGIFSVDTKISEISTLAKTLNLADLGLYILILYGLATVWGTLSGLFPILGIRSFLNRFKLVPYARNPSVWNRVFEVRRPSDRPVTWLKYEINGRIFLAHLCHSSTHIDMDKSFEVYVDKVHVYESSKWIPLSLMPSTDMILCDGMYLRLLPERFIELYFTTSEWNPNNSIQPTAEAAVD